MYYESEQIVAKQHATLLRLASSCRSHIRIRYRGGGENPLSDSAVATSNIVGVNLCRSLSLSILHRQSTAHSRHAMQRPF